jgi:hypothetical protein
MVRTLSSRACRARRLSSSSGVGILITCLIYKIPVLDNGGSVVCPLGLCRANVDIMVCDGQSVWGRVVVLVTGIFVCDMLLSMF